MYNVRRRSVELRLASVSTGADPVEGWSRGKIIGWEIETVETVVTVVAAVVGTSKFC
jgi:hypothetical protein